MISLEELVVCGGIQIKCLPEFGESMKNLETLDAKETNLVKFPESLDRLTGLKTLKLRGYKNLVCLPQSIHNLKLLAVIDICGCSKFARLPEKLNEIEALEELDASESDITEIPGSIGGLHKVKKLSFRGCKRSTSNSWSLILPLKHMFWGHSIRNSLTLPASMFNLKSLKELDLSYSSIDDGSILDDLGGLPSLRKLDLSGNMLKNLPAGCISNLLKLEFLFLNSCSELRSLPELPPSLTTMDAGECASLEAVADEQLLYLFASIDQALTWIGGNETLSVTIPGSEIPSWFENQHDLCLDDKGEASMKIDMPPCEEMLGIGLCIVLDEKFYSIEPSIINPAWFFDFAYSRSVIPGRDRGYGKEIKSSHLWIMFWKQREELGHMLQLSKYNHIPLTFAVHGGKLDAQVSIKCGWRVVRKGDFENSSSSIKNRSSPISQSLLSTLNQESTMSSDEKALKGITMASDEKAWLVLSSLGEGFIYQFPNSQVDKAGQSCLRTPSSISVKIS